MKALSAGFEKSSTVPEDSPVEDFSASWSRSEELQSILRRLPGQLVLKSGLSGQRGRLLEQWEKLETPGLDGVIPSKDMLIALRKWIANAEALIFAIVRLNPSEKKSDTRTYSAPITDSEDLPQVINSIDESDAVSDKWYWPWDKKQTTAIAKKEKKTMDKGTLIKYGVAGAVGLMVIVSLIESEEE